LLTGRLPFQADSQLLFKHLNNELPPYPSTINADIPKNIDTVILRALAKKPEDRYPSISGFAKEFEQAALSGEKGEDIQVILSISEAEALRGTRCTLPSSTVAGQQVDVTVPAR